MFIYRFRMKGKYYDEEKEVEKMVKKIGGGSGGFFTRKVRTFLQYQY